MTTIRFHFKPPGKEEGLSGKLYIRIIHGRRYRDLRRDYPVRVQEWDDGTGWLRLPGSADIARHRQLRSIEDSMRSDLLRLENIATTLGARGEYTVGDIVGEFRRTGNHDTLLSFCDRVSRELAVHGRPRTARAYRSAVKSLVRFNGGRDLFLDEVCPALLREYERHLLDRGLQMNTVSFYMRNLRALWNRAVSAKLLNRAESSPFADVYTGVYETRRRALDRQDINALALLEKKIAVTDTRLRNALLYFLFAYHSRGMSFIDLAHLKKSDVRDGTIIYRRRKTGFYMEVKITRPMKKIMDRFRAVTKGSPYIFPIIDPSAPDPRLLYESALNRQNRLLKELAGIAGLEKNLSTHVARHTWATMAKRMGYGVNIISEGLGHRDTKTTSIYLASFERSALDELSNRVSRAVRAA
ncbi:MAG: site-specific integrase [Alistipes sp.]|nr:site-specific integrase [Alistipes sp.]